ncbi:MAG: PEP/pyruvate-binding domain-containing protein [Anaerolineaceae bacterium]|nr:PEP/pyruvate-binding domain-containing protein [Anaerolineaceae bacterium]
MSDRIQPLNDLIHELKERAKELNCLYEVQELLGQPERSVEEISQGLIKVIPFGWQYPDVCQAKVSLAGYTVQSPDLIETPWVQSADILVQDETIGTISVYYIQERPASDEGPFLKEERKLINTIAEQVGFYILHQQLRKVFQQQLKSEEEQKNEWQVVLDLLKRTDPGLLMRITRKMVNYLVWNGAGEAEHLLERLWPAEQEQGRLNETNQPFKPPSSSNLLVLTDEVFAMADQHLQRDVILDNIQKWIKEDRSGFLVNTLVNPGSSLAEIDSALERYHHLTTQGIELTAPREKWFRVALIRRILSDQVSFLNIAKNYIEIDDFNDFMRRTIYPLGSHGKLGGKSSGLFLAEKILKRSAGNEELLRDIKIPKTWYLPSDSVFSFMSYHNLEDIIEQKYKDISQIRQEYPYIVHVFKNFPLPPEIIKGLSLALDDCRDVPLIVRSSSLLEDQSGQAFAGKYKSLFIANQGSKEERLVALMDAVKEVFASMFGPDPMEYRLEHNLLDIHEEMGILIQEVVGTGVGPYYLPAFAGIAFSRNDYRWSSRIRRQDGMIRMVPGLGTRAVDRLSDDYPVLISPGQPGLRPNVTPEEIACYSPRKIDLINLKSRSFETIEIQPFLKKHAREYPAIHQIVSVNSGDFIYNHLPIGPDKDFEDDEFIVSFDGLFSRTHFLKQIRAILNVLEGAFDHPVDIEFAHDGVDLYLLQCRSQSYSSDSMPAELPKEISHEDLLFSANRYITNGTFSGITHIVYVDPKKYSELSNYQDLVAVGRAVGRLNQILPRHHFILMGPGRWGSRGDIKLGISVTYSDISNTLILIEIALKQNGYVPDLSFGTHFFQDLVEASIRYLPLYPDDRGVVFNEGFLTSQQNCLSALLPEFAALEDVIHVIDLPSVTNGKSLKVLMNADNEEAVAFLVKSDKK